MLTSPHRCHRHKGFTLIELLVVVLIIGILAAIALPMYQRAVEKSKVSQLKILVKNVAQAQERYFMTNGSYANDFASLDIVLGAVSNPSESSLGPNVSSADAVRRYDNFEIVLNNNSGGLFKCVLGSTNIGKYKGGYISYCFELDTTDVPLRQILCLEDSRPAVFTATAGDFCIKTVGFKTLRTTIYNVRMYTEH